MSIFLIIIIILRIIIVVPVVGVALEVSKHVGGCQDPMLEDCAVSLNFTVFNVMNPH